MQQVALLVDTALTLTLLLKGSDAEFPSSWHSIISAAKTIKNIIIHYAFSIKEDGNIFCTSFTNQLLIDQSVTSCKEGEIILNLE